MLVKSHGSPASNRVISPKQCKVDTATIGDLFGVEAKNGGISGKDRQIQARVDFVLHFAYDHALMHTPKDDFDPYEAGRILSHCMINMTSLSHLFCYRVRVYFRFLMVIVRWVRRWIWTRDSLIDKLVKKWVAYDHQRKFLLTDPNSSDDKVFEDWLSDSTVLALPASERERKREVVLLLYYKKRKHFRKKFRFYRELVTSKQQEITSIRKQLEKESGKEKYHELQLEEKIQKLIAEIRLLHQHKPKFSVHPSTFIQEIQSANRKVQALKEELDFDRAGLNMSMRTFSSRQNNKRSESISSTTSSLPSLPGVPSSPTNKSTPTQPFPSGGTFHSDSSISEKTTSSPRILSHRDGFGSARGKFSPPSSRTGSGGPNTSTSSTSLARSLNKIPVSSSPNSGSSSPSNSPPSPAIKRQGLHRSATDNTLPRLRGAKR